MTLLLALACVVDPADSAPWWAATPVDRSVHVTARPFAAEICDGVDNDGDGATDEDCGTCDWLVTRTKDQWATYAAAINRTGTCDLALLPIRLGATKALTTFAAVRTELLASTANPKQAVGTFLTAVELNAKVYPIGEVPFSDWDGDGDEETVTELIALADGLYDAGTTAQRNRMATVLEALTEAGTGYASWYDLTCANDHELCDGVDNDADGTADDGCLCTEELCDGADNDGDGSVDEGAGCALTAADLAPGDLVVTEVMKDPDLVSDTDGEWFEVYNALGEDVDLDGLVVSDDGADSFTVSGSLVVGAGAYAVFGRSDDTGLNGGVDVDYVFAGMTLGNADDEIVLEGGGMELDRVAWDGGLLWVDPAGASLTLDPLRTSGDNNDPTGWCEATSTYGLGDAGTPGAFNDSCGLVGDLDGDGWNNDVDCDELDVTVNPGATENWYDGVDQDCSGGSDFDQDLDGFDSDAWGGDDCDDSDPAISPAAAEVPDDGVDQDCDGEDAGFTVDLLLPGDLVISEIMADPSAVSDSLGEWFEVYNATPYTVDLEGLEVADGDGWAVTLDSVVVPAGGYAVLGASGDTGANGGAPVDWSWGGGSYLGNLSDSLMLFVGTTTIDEVAWDGGVLFPDPKGASLNLDVASLDAASNDDGASWCASGAAFGDGDLGTPGEANDVCLVGGGTPSAWLWPAWLDFGVVDLGCEATSSAWLVNLGDAALEVTALTVEGDAGYVLDPAPTLPFTLAAGTGTPLALTFAPEAGGVASATLVVESDDPTGDALLDLEGEGGFTTTVADTFAVREVSKVDLLFVVDKSCSMAEEQGRLGVAFPDIVAEVEALVPDWHVLATDDVACAASGVLDPGVKGYEATFAADVLGTGGPSTEEMFAWGVDALDLTDVGECNQGFLRPDALLHIIHVSDEEEQSPLTVEYYVNLYGTFVTDPALLRVSGIVGMGGSCSFSTTSRFADAARLTGGALYDICDSTWSPFAAGLAADSWIDPAVVRLSEEPVESTLVVTLNGADAAGDWIFDGGTGTVTFVSNIPVDGDVVEATYAVAGVCVE